MYSFLSRLSSSLRAITEDQNADWKDPYSPDYTRKYAEDCLYHTVGPLTANPTWSPKNWYPRESKMAPPTGYAPGGPAPRWTKEEIVIAFAGDPSQMWKYGPKSPQGSPMMRFAQRLGETKKRGGKQEVMDLYQLGLTELVKLMMPGRDGARSAFISWVTPTIIGSMKHGVGVTADERLGITTLKKLATIKRPEQIQAIIDPIGEKYQHEGDQQYDKDPENPYGQHSPNIYTLGTELLQAIESADETKIENLRKEIQAIADEAEERGEVIPGATTGAFSAISTPDRETRLGLTSIDKPMGDEGNTPAETLIGSVSDDIGKSIDQEAVAAILDIGLNIDLVDVYGSSSDFDEFLQAADATRDEVVGPFTADEFRIIIRNLGNLAATYPGKGRIRQSLDKPRDSAGWWLPGEDPEIEKIPETGKIWKSKWLREGLMAMSNEDIAKEFVEEMKEFKELGIRSARGESLGSAQKVGDTNLTARDMELYQLHLDGLKGAEIARRVGISKQNVSNRLKKIALAMQLAEPGTIGISPEFVSKTSNSVTKKILLISKIYSEEITGTDLEESKHSKLNIIRESFDPVDRKIISENAKKLYNLLEQKMVKEYAQNHRPFRAQDSTGSLRELYLQAKMKSFSK
jgi:hypothetical protein